MNHFFRSVCFILFSVFFLTSCKKERRDLEFSIDLLDTNDLIKEIIEEIRINYADDIAREKLEIGAINGMLQVLDEYSQYIPREEFNAFNQSTRGAFLGIGIEIKAVNDGIEIQSVIDESPAAKAGIKHGDLITKINEKDVAKMTQQEIATTLSSDTSIKLKLSLLRNKSEVIDVSLKKSVIQLRSVKLSFINDMALIKINYFNNGTVLDVSQAIKEINKKKSLGVMIDLRNNPGGILDQAVGVADLFLNDKKIVELKSRNIGEAKVVMSDDTDLLNNLPMAVLVNSNTASGAELLAAALGENKRAVLIGEKTYGKGSMQTVIPIPGKGAIRLTTAHFISPNGNAINHNGVVPDILIQNDEKQPETQDEKVEPIIQRAIDILRSLSALNETDDKDA